MVGDGMMATPPQSAQVEAEGAARSPPTSPSGVGATPASAPTSAALPAETPMRKPGAASSPLARPSPGPKRSSMSSSATGGSSSYASSLNEVTDLLPVAEDKDADGDLQDAMPGSPPRGYGSTLAEAAVCCRDDGGDALVSDKVVVSAVANLSTAYNLAVINYALLMLQPTYPVASPAVTSLVSSLSLVGAIVGQLTFGYVGTVLGRRKGMIFTLMLSVLGAAASAVLPWGEGAVYQLLAASRFVLGVGVGGVYPLSAASAVESSNDDLKKSKLTAAVFSFQGVGQLLAPVSAYVILHLGAYKTVGWRVLLFLGALPGLFVLRKAFNVPEDVVPSPDTSAEKSQAATSQTELWHKLCDDAKLRHKLFGACATWFLFDLTFYGNVIFTPIILQDTYGFDKHQLPEVALCSIVVAVIALPGTLLTVLLVGKLSFKTIQIVGFLAMALLFLLLGVFYSQLLQFKALLLTLYALTFFFSNFGPNVGTFCLPAEIFPAAVRVELNGVAAACGKLGAAVGAASFGLIEGRLGVSYLLALSATVSLLGALVTYKFIPDKHYRYESVSA